MKQGHAEYSEKKTKSEPKGTAVSPKVPARMGMQLIPTKPFKRTGPGYMAPPSDNTVYKCGTQGKH